jgi:SNF2-related domain
MRPASNLRDTVGEYSLSKEQLRSGFIGLFQSRVGKASTLVDAAFGLAAGALYPQSRGMDFRESDIRKPVESFFLDPERARTVRASLRKNLPLKRLEFRFPLAAFVDTNIVGALNGMSAFGALPSRNRGDYNSAQSYETSPMKDKLITGADIEDFSIPDVRKKQLQRCLVAMELKKTGANEVQLWITLAVSKEEAEFITNCSFTELRMSDIYPTFIDWAATVFGRFGRTPVQINKVSKIAASVRGAFSGQPARPRVGVDSMVADIHGQFYIIPEVDQSAQYEQMMMDFGMREDGSYSWKPEKTYSPDGTGELTVDVSQIEDTRRKLPTNMPIFTDWLNDKFVYSNTAGNLAVYDLSDTVPVGAGHIVSALNHPFILGESKTSTEAVLINALNTAGNLDPSIFDEMPLPSDGTENREAWTDTLSHYSTHRFGSAKEVVADAAKLSERYRRNLDNVPKSFVSLGPKDVASFATLGANCDADEYKFVARMMRKAYVVLTNNTEVLFTRMSVMSALHILALMQMVEKHAPNYEQIVQQDKDEKKVYTEQGLDKDYTPPPIPLLRASGLELQPHQARVDNMGRNSPKFMAYPVDAGGGKTILILTNVLRELGKNNIRRAIIACPSTLVSQYVTEVVFVTEGRLNIIPVTNATLRAHGEERLKSMIENAPVNTIVVTDFDFIKGRAVKVAYGNKSVIVWTNAEFLRQFEFDLITLDESHKLKNLNSARRAGMARLMQDIPYKRLASGTLVDNTIVDLVSQIALFDPTIFGSQEKFRDEYAANTKGDRVLAWRDGAEREIRQKIEKNVVMAGARRKEWAALLPQDIERFHAVELTQNQELLYQSILKETTDLIQEAMEKDEELKESLGSEDESVVESLEMMLKPYLTRLEKFLSSPETDQAADLFLKSPEDRVSPKVRKIHEICKKHLDENIPGKILIFTNFLDSAEAVFRHAPPELKKKMIHYKASEKMDARSAFEGRPDKPIMVGSSASMDTGLNFQMASRLIRMETIWTPGILEQGNSRINRPQLKNKETRTNVYFDWLMVNRTIDVTKIARLTAKIISKSKFDEHDNEKYQAIESLPVISMTIDSIAAQNDFQESLMPYLVAYNQYKIIQQEEYAEYRETELGKQPPVKVESAGILPGSKFMTRVPYVAGMSLYAPDDLGLVRYDQFINRDLIEMEMEDSDETSDDDLEIVTNDDPKAAQKRAMQARWSKELQLVNGCQVHTQYGDGVIYGARKKVWVEFNDGSKMKVPKLETFIITRTTTNSKDMRLQLMKAVGNIPPDRPIEVPVETGTQTEKIKSKLRGEKTGEKKDKSVHASFSFSVINDMLAITFDGQGNPEAGAALQNFGFKMSPDMVFTRIIGPKVMLSLFKAWNQKGYTISRPVSSKMKKIYEALHHDKKSMQRVGFATSMDIMSFQRDNIKPSSDPYELKIYPTVENGVLYMVMPTKGQAANNRARRVTVTNIRWIEGGGEAEYIRFCKNKAEAKQVLLDIKESGIIIDNTEELGKQFKAINMGAKK